MMLFTCVASRLQRISCCPSNLSRNFFGACMDCTKQSSILLFATIPLILKPLQAAVRNCLPKLAIGSIFPMLRDKLQGKLHRVTPDFMFVLHEKILTGSLKSVFINASKADGFVKNCFCWYFGRKNSFQAGL